MNNKVSSTTAGIVIGIFVLLIVGFGIYKWRAPQTGPAVDAEKANQDIENQYKQLGPQGATESANSGDDAQQQQSQTDREYQSAGRK